MKKQPNAEEFCRKIKGTEFLETFNKMRNEEEQTMKEIADHFGISKYTLRTILKKKFGIELEPGKPIRKLKFQDE